MENSSVIAVGGSDPVHRREKHPSSYYRALKKKFDKQKPDTSSSIRSAGIDSKRGCQYKI